MRTHWILIFLSFCVLSSLSFPDKNRAIYKTITKPYQKGAVDFTLLDSNNKPVSLSQFRGKFVIITMEANWCGPCIRELQPTKELQADLLGQNVVWIFISFDRDRESWDDSRRENKLNGIQLWGKPKAEELKKTFNFDSLPYYIWIDKDGSIVVDDAPRPSSRSAKNQLKLYLNG